MYLVIITFVDLHLIRCYRTPKFSPPPVSPQHHYPFSCHIQSYRNENNKSEYEPNPEAGTTNSSN